MTVTSTFSDSPCSRILPSGPTRPMVNRDLPALAAVSVSIACKDIKYRDIRYFAYTATFDIDTTDRTVLARSTLANIVGVRALQKKYEMRLTRSDKDVKNVRVTNECAFSCEGDVREAKFAKNVCSNCHFQELCPSLATTTTDVPNAQNCNQLSAPSSLCSLIKARTL